MDTGNLIAAGTIASPNYLPFVRALALSYKKHHPGQQFFALIVARGLDRHSFSDEPYIPVLLEDIGLKDLPSLAMKYNILELNTNVKPQFLLHLLNAHSLDAVIYLDPDILVYRPLAPVFELLNQGSVALTPHITSPADTAAEQEMLFNGTFNLGFIAVRRHPGAIRMLEWWNDRCIENGYSEGRSGLFVDQKWMNLAPALFEGILQLKHPGCNVGFWNFQERLATREADGYRINGEPLCFFHFSGVSIYDVDTLSKNTTRYSFANRADLRTIYDEYRALVRDNLRPSLDSLPYGFDIFEDGTAITLLTRRIYAAHQQAFLEEDPFCSSSRLFRFATSHGLTAGHAKPDKVGWKDMKQDDRRVALIHRLLLLALRTLGPNRYELLMRYLGFISILRNQGVFLKPDSR